MIDQSIILNYMDYQQLLTNIVQTYKIPIIHGKTHVFIWNDEQDLLEWCQAGNPKAEKIRMTTVPSTYLPMLSVGDRKSDDVCILAIGIGIKKDYSDTNCLFHMVVAKINDFMSGGINDY